MAHWSKKLVPKTQNFQTTFAFLACCASLHLSAQTVSQAKLPTADVLRPLEVSVNGENVGGWLLIERSGVLYAPKEAFVQWRLMLRPTAQSIKVAAQEYFALASVPGFESKIDLTNQSLALTFAPENFDSTRQQERLAIRPKVDRVLPSVFLNYDLNFAANFSAGAPNNRNLGALTELGISTNAGVFTSSAVGRNLIKSGTNGEAASWVRLNTTFTRDYPESNRTLRLGDSTTRGSLLGRNAYFGGIQYGTNFALTPGFISQPLLTISGLSSAPSTVELYINNVLRQTTNVPTGPFTLTDLPTFNGTGDARLIVRDLLGRETVVTQSFFSNSQLLAADLADWSVEAGALRQGLGVSNASYGAGFVSGTYKQGLTSEVTAEGRAELTRELQTLGLGAIAALPGQMLGRAAFMSSRSALKGAGIQWLIGADYNQTVVNANLQIQGASTNFRQLGLDAFTLPTRLQIAGNVSYFIDSKSNISAGFAVADRFDTARVSTLTLGYNQRIFDRGNLRVFAARSIADVASNIVGISLSLPVGDKVITSAGIENSNRQTNSYVSANGSALENGSLGWRLLASQQANTSRAEGGLSYASQYGLLSSDVSKSGDQTALRLGISGGLLAADGRLFASERLNESFAVVEVPGYPGLNVLLGNRVLAKTDAKGVAVLPGLAPFQSNSIQLDTRDLPISAEIDNLVQSAVPASRSGVKLVFASRLGRAALLNIMFDDGEAAPAGATLTFDTTDQEFFVARRGQAYVTGLDTTNQVVLKWKNQQCTLVVLVPLLVKDDIARVGPLLCKGVQR